MVYREHSIGLTGVFLLTAYIAIKKLSTKVFIQINILCSKVEIRKETKS